MVKKKNGVRRVYIFVTVLVALALISVVVFFVPLMTGAVIGTVSGCTDSDGDNPYTAGATKYKYWFIFTATAADKCYGDYMNERYCEYGKVKTRKVYCDKGCENVNINLFDKDLISGQCRKKAIPCRDTDKGIDDERFGVVTSSRGVYFDRCTDESLLKEYYCDRGNESEKTIVCRNGCKAGACLKGTLVRESCSTMCIDSDEGLNYSKKGVTTFSEICYRGTRIVSSNKTRYTDYCLDSDNLVEYSCGSKLCEDVTECEAEPSPTPVASPIASPTPETSPSPSQTITGSVIKENKQTTCKTITKCEDVNKKITFRCENGCKDGACL